MTECKIDPRDLEHAVPVTQVSLQREDCEEAEWSMDVDEGDMQLLPISFQSANNAPLRHYAPQEGLEVIARLQRNLPIDDIPWIY